MAKNKLARFAEMATYDNVFQYSFDKLKNEGFPLKGRWNSFFNNNQPVILELGCGKGEYTVGLARVFPDKNFIGIDIKGARMWKGATQAINEKLKNVAFVRSRIELISYFFSQGEVSEIWITFPDPRMKKVNKRLTSTRFMREYANILQNDGTIHLKTDSNFLYQYTRAMIQENQLPLLVDTDDLYKALPGDNILGIKTFYEQQWLERGIKIKYLRFRCSARGNWVEPEVEIEKDNYRSFGRNQ